VIVKPANAGYIKNPDRHPWEVLWNPRLQVKDRFASAKRPETKTRRLKEFITMLERGESPTELPLERIMKKSRPPCPRWRGLFVVLVERMNSEAL